MYKFESPNLSFKVQQYKSVILEHDHATCSYLNQMHCSSAINYPCNLLLFCTLSTLKWSECYFIFFFKWDVCLVCMNYFIIRVYQLLWYVSISSVPPPLLLVAPLIQHESSVASELINIPFMSHISDPDWCHCVIHWTFTQLILWKYDSTIITILFTASSHLTVPC